MHRKGATRAFGPEHADLPEALRPSGQPVLIGGSMGTHHMFSPAWQRARRGIVVGLPRRGRSMSRHQATRTWRGRQVIDELRERGILIKSPSARGVAEEAPGAYKDVAAVVEVAEVAGLARRVARLAPVICIKG